MIESICRIVLVTGIFIVWLAMALLPTLARATGPGPTPGTTVNVTPNLSSSPSLTSSPSVTGGAVSQENTTRAYGGGSTGLTSTAECLGSRGLLFNFLASTYVEQGCVVRHYAKACKDAACRQAMMCLDPDLLDEAKLVLGCPPAKRMK